MKKSIKFIIVFVLVFMCSFSSMARNMSEINLKNGSIIKGYITREIPNIEYTIETPDGSVIICNYNDIDFINHNINKSYINPSFTNKKYRGFVDLGYYMSISNNDHDCVVSNGLSLTTTHGYQYKHTFIGVGTGMTVMDFENLDYSVFIPLYADIRYDFKNSSSSNFYCELKTGAAIPVFSHYSISPLVSPSMGIRIPINKKTAANISLGYEFILFNCTDDNSYKWLINENNDITCHNLTMKFGVEF